MSLWSESTLSGTRSRRGLGWVGCRPVSEGGKPEADVLNFVLPFATPCVVSLVNVTIKVPVIRYVSTKYAISGVLWACRARDHCARPSEASKRFPSL